MPNFYYKCATLLLAVGMLLTSTTAFAQVAEKTSSAVGLSSTDSDPKPVPVVYFCPDDEVSYTTTRGQWALAEMPTPQVQELFRADKPGYFDEMKTFGVKWNEQEYIRGLATGAASFSITGQYFPLSTEDQALWNQGLILIDAKTVPILEIHVTQDPSLPFTVDLGYDVQAEVYYPIFSFRTPHGASHMLFEASNDGTTWISETQQYHSVAFMEKRNINSMQWLTSDEGHYFSAHQTSYYRVTVHGSAYDVNSGADGSVSTFILSGLPADVKPPDSDLDDSGGNRGGVGQEETERVLPPKDENAQNAAVSPSGGIAGSASSGVAQSRADTATSSEATNKAADDTPKKTEDIPLEEASAHEAITVMGEAELPSIEGGGSSAKPAIPTGAVTAAVCTAVAISAVSVLLKCNWQSILKLFKRKS